MIFIKNFTAKRKEEKIRIQSERTGDNSKISLMLPNDVLVDIVESSVPLLSTSIRRSVEHIGKLTQSLNKNDTTVSANILDDDGTCTEVAVYVKDQKVALMQGEGDKIIPIQVQIAPADNAEGRKRFPRDMVIFIVDKADDTKLVVDNRNLANPPIKATVGDYEIIFAMVKWPIWSNLKFPVYMYVQQGDNCFGSVQLSSRVDNKITKNCVAEVELSEAKEYLMESEKIQNKRNENKGDRRPFNKRENNNGGGGKQSSKGRNQGGNPSVNFPQKFRGNTNNGNKNYRRNGNR